MSKTIPPNVVKALQELKAKQAAGEKLDLATTEAMQAIDLAGKVVASVMSGKQVDIAYLKTVSDLVVKRLEALEKTSTPRRVKKKKKLFR